MYHTTQLANGVWILSEDIPHVRSVAIGIWVNVGSRDEDDTVSGVSHFLEHLMFKGTHRRSARDIAEALEAVGGQLNAFTTKEYTCYYARVLDEHLGLALDVLTDMLFNSRLAAEDIERERNVIIEEIKMYEDTPDELVHDIFATTLWDGHPLGRPIIGKEEIIRSLPVEKIHQFYREHYTAPNMVVSVAGNIRHEQVVEAIGEIFGKLKPSAGKRQLTPPQPRRQVRCRYKETEQVHICLGVPGLPLRDERVHALQVINTILGGGMSSRLFQEIRENRGLVYSVYSYHSSYHDTGIFGIYAGLNGRNVEPVIELIMKEVRRLRQEGVSAEELKRAKDQIKGNLLLSLESVSTRMSRMGKSLLYLGRIIPPEEVVEKLNQVDNTMLQTVATECFRPELFCVASVGPWQDDGRTLERIYTCLE